MKSANTIFKLLATLSGFFIVSTYAAGSNQTPVGYWKTIDDVTGKPKSIVRIYENEQHLLMGQVVKIYPSAGKTQDELCAECRGDKHNQPIVGMVILSGLKASEHQWGNGEILDPQNGKTYNCNAKLAENGQHLNVRGYIGLPLLGRSQTWQRVDLMSAKG